MMNRLIGLIVLGMSVCWHSADAQSDHYSISVFEDEYVELEEYNSMIWETLGDNTWSKRFELDFSFPFYDSVYTHINCSSSSTCLFDGSEVFNFYLLAFIYKFDKVTDTNNITSDLRYTQLEKDGLKALVLQYTNNRLATDPSIEEYNSYINFQTWFFENGDVEIRFGDINLDNSPCYVPGEGFQMFFNGGDDTIKTGPDVLLRHPDSAKLTGYGIGGPYDNYIIYDYGDDSDVLSVLPPEDWVIKFHKKASTKTNNESIGEKLAIYPNPTNSTININSELPVDFDKIQIISMEGFVRKEFTDRYDQQIDISDLPSGMYLVKFIRNNSTIIRKVIKR